MSNLSDVGPAMGEPAVDDPEELQPLAVLGIYPATSNPGHAKLAMRRRQCLRYIDDTYSQVKFTDLIIAQIFHAYKALSADWDHHANNARNHPQRCYWDDDDTLSLENFQALSAPIPARTRYKFFVNRCTTTQV